MDANSLKEQLLKSEGYAFGFKDGYASCAKYVAEELMKDDLKKKRSEEKEKSDGN